MYNKIILMGRIVNDPELKTTPNGANVCTFRIAVDRRFQKQGEERKSDFFNVVVWRQQADFVSRYFSKGRMILVEGEMTTRQYTDKNGNNATWYEVIAERVSFTGEKSQGGSSPAPQGAPPVPSAPPQFEDVGADDDYPF
jgi:single-strand DNA-binding protein